MPPHFPGLDWNNLAWLLYWVFGDETFGQIFPAAAAIAGLGLAFTIVALFIDWIVTGVIKMWRRTS